MGWRIQNNQGFTLLELTIVLVVIALLIAGVLAGQNMIRSAELRAVITDVEMYKSAVHAFKDQYGKLPGDLPTASQYWSNCNDYPPAGAATLCDGDGNGDIDGASGEDLRAWEVLARSSMISGEYAGKLLGGLLVPGENVPESKIIGGIFYLEIDTVHTRRDNALLFMGLGAPKLSPSEAETIDAKMDDALAAYGEVYAYNGAGATDCIDMNNAYRVDIDTHQCDMAFWLEF